MQIQAKLAEQLDALANRVGLARVSLSTLPAHDEDVSTEEIDMQLKTNALCWQSDYALLIACRCTSSQMQMVADWGASRIYAALVTWERRQNIVRDGYILLIIDEITDNLLPLVRKIELNSSICRRYVIWPSKATDSTVQDVQWQLLSKRVGILGLPTLPMRSHHTGSLSITLRSEQLIEKVERARSTKDAIEDVVASFSAME